MSLSMFKDTPTQALRKIETDLRLMRPDIDFRSYHALTPRKLEEKIERLRAKNGQLREALANRTWLLDPNYMYRKMFIEGLEIVRDLREAQEESETLQNGMIYYRGVMQFGDTITGQRCMVREGFEPVWANFSEKVAVQKAYEILRYGEQNDFRAIYMEAADGLAESMSRVNLRHIRESSDASLSQIEAYCDSRWDGPWPWEMRPSLKLQSQIEEQEMIRKMNIVEMQEIMTRAITNLYEGEMDKYEVVGLIQTMVDQVDSMIKDLGKLSSAGIEASAGARAFVGDEVGGQIETALQPVLNQAAQSLSSLKTQLEQTKQQIEQSSGEAGLQPGGPAMAPGMQGGDAGMSPNDAMGGAAGGDPLAGSMADVDLNGANEERSQKAF